MKTNLTFNQMLSIAKYGMTNKIDIKSLNLKGDSNPMDGIYYYKLDESSVQSISNEFADELGIKQPFLVQHRIQTKVLTQLALLIKKRPTTNK